MKGFRSALPAGRLLGVAALCIALVAGPSVCPAQDTPLSAEQLAGEQADLAREFQRLQTLAKRIAEMTEAEDPARAEQLRQAIRKSQDLELGERFAAIVSLLEDERLAAAARDQSTLAQQLQTLLGMLLADPNQARIEAERKRLQAALKELERQIRSQQELRANTPAGDAAELAERQQRLAEEVEGLEQRLREGDQPDGAPSSEQQPPANGEPQGQGDQAPRQDAPGGEEERSQNDPSQNDADSDVGDPAEPSPAGQAAERLRAAQQRMREAAEKLEQIQQNEGQQDGSQRDEAQRDRAQRDRAQREQTEAQRALEDAREEIKRALRQLREEEQRQMLTRLATRLRRMLAEQSDVLALTRQAEQDRPNRGRRATSIAATGLANRQQELITTADGALRLLREDGQSVAYPEVISQVRDDMLGVEKRLRSVDLGPLTQRIQEEIVLSLEEAIASLDKTLKELEERQQNGQQGQQGGEPGDPPLVDKLAELRMIRMIQVRILRRTRFWEDRRAESGAGAPEAESALLELSRRQARMMQALRSVGGSGGD
ncbi:MAG: hypothetical protein AAF790_04530 [Planctomycetota bacterium]